MGIGFGRVALTYAGCARGGVTGRLKEEKRVKDSEFAANRSGTMGVADRDEKTCKAIAMVLILIMISYWSNSCIDISGEEAALLLVDAMLTRDSGERKKLQDPLTRATTKDDLQKF